MRSIDLINGLLAKGALQGLDCKTVLVHRIDGGPALDGLAGSPKPRPTGS